MSITTLKPKDGRKIPRYASFTETVDVEISADDLHEDGWHHENECPAGPGPLSDEPAYVTLRAAVEALHSQAHGPGSIVLCRAEPGSSLSIDQLRGVA
jgi:hypothetical protein